MTPDEDMVNIRSWRFHQYSEREGLSLVGPAATGRHLAKPHRP